MFFFLFFFLTSFNSLVSERVLKAETVELVRRGARAAFYLLYTWCDMFGFSFLFGLYYLIDFERSVPFRFSLLSALLHVVLLLCLNFLIVRWAGRRNEAVDGGAIANSASISFLSDNKLFVESNVASESVRSQKPREAK